jgi:hypothetical protein
MVGGSLNCGLVGGNKAGRRREIRMSAAVTTERGASDASPRIKARIAAVLYLLEGLPAVLQQAVIARLIVPGDAAATATNVLANESLFRLWFAAALLAVACHIAYTVLFYDLFRPVNRTIALLAAAISLVACALQAFATLFQLIPLLALDSGTSLGVLTPGQAQTVALVSLNLHTQAFNIYLVFFGFWLIATGYLILRSTFFPRVIGALLVLDGLGWALFLWPPLAISLYPVISAVAAVAEISLVLWLLVVGVNGQRWKEQAGKA